MCEPRDLAYWHEVFVLLTYSKSRAMAYRNAAVKEKAVIRNYDGMNIGFTEEIRYIDGSWDERTCLGVMKFNDPEGARHWLQSDHPFRQPDFLDQVDILIVPLQKSDMSHKGYPIIEILNLRIKMKEVFESKYLTEMKCLIKECGGCPLIVQHDDVWKWRGSKNPGSIIINQWPDWESYHKYSTKDETRKLEELRKTIGCGYKIVAELIIDM